MQFGVQSRRHAQVSVCIQSECTVDVAPTFLLGAPGAELSCDYRFRIQLLIEMNTIKMF